MLRGLHSPRQQCLLQYCLDTTSLIMTLHSVSLIRRMLMSYSCLDRNTIADTENPSLSMSIVYSTILAQSHMCIVYIAI